MLSNPNKPIDLLCFTVPQKYFALITLFFASIVLPYDYISIAAVLIVGTTLHFIRSKNILNACASRVEKIFGCGKASCNLTSIGYITAEVGNHNAETCTDAYVPFNRRQIKGHVSSNAGYR